MLKDKVGIVTGAGSGLGTATALAMAREGATVMLTDRDAEALASAAAALEASGRRCASHPADVTDEDAVREMVDRTLAELGPLDIAFNSAGVEGSQGLIHEQSLDEVERTLDINLKGVYRCMKHEIRAMLESGGGAIVNAASTWGLNAHPARAGYISSKHALVGLTKTAALELAQRNVRVNAVAPGPINTPMLARDWSDNLELAAAGVPMGRIGEPDEVAEAVVWLCSERASFVTGHTLPIDGGMLCAVG